MHDVRKSLQESLFLLRTYIHLVGDESQRNNCLSLLFWLPFLTLDDFHDVWRIAELLILYILGALFSNRDFWIDPAFSDDVEELEYRLEEQA